jgi:hypothetical protein
VTLDFKEGAALVIKVCYFQGVESLYDTLLSALYLPLIDREANGRDLRSTALRKRMNSLWRWRCMQRPITVPSTR